MALGKLLVASGALLVAATAGAGAQAPYPPYPYGVANPTIRPLSWRP